MNISVVGCGFGGLAAAALLSREGHNVTVLEKNDQPGGRARVWREASYTFDMGPSWYLMPDVFDKFFSELNEKVSDYYELMRIDPSYRINFEGGSTVDVSANLEENMKLFDSFEPDGGEKLRKYLAQAERHYNLAMGEMMYRDYDSILDMVSGKLALEGFKLPLFSDMDSYVGKIFKSEKARKILEYSIGFIGGSPKNTPALYYIMNHVDFKLGVWYPKEGGMGRLVNSVKTVAEKNGAEFRFNTPVTKIEGSGKKATRVHTPQGPIDTDLVIVNADYPHGELDLIDAEHRSYDEKYWARRVIAPSALVGYIGLDKKIDSFHHHNLYLSKDWLSDFDAIFNPKTARWPESPSYYVNVPSRSDSTVSPRGGETLFLLLPLAPDLEDTPELREKMYKKLVSELEQRIGEPIIGEEVVKRLYSVNDYRADYNAYKGTALGLTHTLRQTALFRPSHKSKRVNNLYYTGHYTHPGVGVPMTLISSQILAKTISKKYGER
jgi:phytoene desaturase